MSDQDRDQSKGPQPDIQINEWSKSNQESNQKLPAIVNEHQDAEKAKIIDIIPDEVQKLNFQQSEEMSPLSPDIKKQSQGRRTQEDETKRPDESTKTEEKASNEKKKKNQILVKIDKFLNHWGVTIFMSIVTLYALFAEDIRQLSFTQEADYGFSVITCICIFFFTVEILLASFAQEGYFFGFYFWLDLVSTVSMVFDIIWLWELLTGTDQEADGQAQVQKSTRAARVGTRAARITRVIRLIRLIRVVKLYKSAQTSQQRDDLLLEDDEIQPMGSNEENKKQKTEVLKQTSATKDQKENNEQPAYQESKVGKKLSDLTMKRVIILVLVMLFSVPLFSASSYLDTFSSYTFGLELLTHYEMDSDAYNEALRLYIETETAMGTPLIYVNASNTIWKSSTDFNDLRTGELSISGLNHSDDYIAYHDMRNSLKLQSGLSIGTTLFVCFILATAALLFSKQTNELVITPIEQMIIKVNRIAANPLLAAQEEENQALAEERARELNESKRKNKKKPKLNKKVVVMETVILEQTIVKIGALLALGFGEAGSKIIHENMSGSGDINPMLPGQKTVAIFGFCDIRNFTDATEVLQEGVMVFVNEIGEIVHGIVDQFSGAANKNIGDAFLLVWKFQDEDMELDQEKDIISLKDNNRVSQLADMSVISFLKIIAALKTSRNMLKYKEHKGLNDRMPNYSVKIGYGLHVGWAIEGAIGSFYKIDASYLSPNVNMASRLEGATKQFGTPLLVSGELVNIMTPHAQTQMRIIDRVAVKGSIETIELYTCDTDITDLEVEPMEFQKTKKQQKLIRVRQRIMRDRLRQMAYDGQIQVSAKFETDKDLVEMRKGFSKKFFDTFKEGFDFYIKGEWSKARDIFNEVEEVKGSIDQPTRNLLAVLAESDYQAPKDWPGYRVTEI